MGASAELLGNVWLGLQTALSPANLMYCALGVTLGTLLGVIPGIGVLVSISLLFPITYHMDSTAALVMLAGVFYGTTYGGSTASILLNVPGTPANAVACLDGYPMARQGRAGQALLVTTVASFVGGSIGILVMMGFSPLIAANALRFGSQEFFSLMVLGLVAASTISGGSPLKGLSMVVLGILLGLVGIDINSGAQRFTFGVFALFDGISMVALAMGLFGAAEVMASVRSLEQSRFDPRSLSLGAMLPSAAEARRSVLPMLRGSGIGSFFGALPGTGGLIAAFMAYAVERRISRTPEAFGKGAIEGLAAPEAANNAADQTAFIPTLTLGIPGSATMAIILGVLIVHGITPGPRLVSDRPELFWGLIMSFWIGNVLLLILNIPLIGVWVRVLTVPYRLMYPAVLAFICVGVYSVNRSSFDVGVVAAAGCIGYLMRAASYPAAPLVLGFVLGPMMEENFRRSLLLSQGDFATFVNRPISGTLIGLSALLLLGSIIGPLLTRRRRGHPPAP